MVFDELYILYVLYVEGSCSIQYRDSDGSSTQKKKRKKTCDFKIVVGMWLKLGKNWRYNVSRDLHIEIIENDN